MNARQPCQIPGCGRWAGTNLDGYLLCEDHDGALTYQEIERAVGHTPGGTPVQSTLDHIVAELQASLDAKLADMLPGGRGCSLYRERAGGTR